jgi:hypothetical protein
MSNVIVVPDKMGVSNLAESICAEAGVNFVPNIIVNLRLPEPIPRPQLNKDFCIFFITVAHMMESEPLPLDFPYVIAARRAKKVKEGRIWARLNRSLVKNLPIDKMPKLWELMYGGEAEFLVGRESAFDDLLNTCEARKEELLFSIYDAEDDDD